MRKIRVYDLKSFIESQDFEGRKLTTTTDKMAIITNDNKAIIFDCEGVGRSIDSLLEPFSIGLNDIPEDNHKFYIMAQYSINMPISEIISEVNYEEMELKQFLDRHDYNRRLRANFEGILKAIDEIGINSLEYIKNKKEILK